MKYRISLTVEVTGQILSTSSYYEGAREGLGIEFESEMQKILKAIASRPMQFMKEFGPIRRAPISRFKQVVFYTVEGDLITILEIRDARRKPPNWRRRGFQDN